MLDNDFPTAAELIAKAEFSCLQDYKDSIESVSGGVLDEFNLLYVALTRAKELLEHENCEAIKYINMKENELDFKIRKAYEKNMQQKNK